jgi:DNA-binding transcriptional LysR family regulator
MDLRQLRYFIAAAEELHVARAAGQLGLTQPALSQHIRALEERVGVRLFLRANRRITLTAAGSAFLAEARQAVFHADQAVRTAQRAARGETGSINIGYVSSALGEPAFLQGLAEFGRQHPDVIIEMHLQNFKQNVTALRQESDDIAILRGPLTEMPEGYEHFTFSNWAIQVALPTEHPLANTPQVRLADLDQETLLLPDDPPGCGLADTIHRVCATHAFIPRRSMVVNETSSAVGMVAGGLGIALLPESASTLRLPGVSFCPLAPPVHHSELLVLFKRFERSPAIQSLLLQLRGSAPAQQSPPR